MPRRPDAGVRRAAAAALTVALCSTALFWLVRSPHGASMVEHAAAVGPSGWLLVLLALGFTYALRAARLMCEWRGRVAIAPLDALFVILVHTAAVHLLPMRSGEMVFPLTLQRRHGIAVADAAGSLAWMRLQDMLTVAWLGGLTGTAWGFRGGRLDAWGAALAAVTTTLCFVACAARAGLVAQWWFDGLAQSSAGVRVRGRWRGVLERLCAAAARAAQRQSRETWLWCTATWTVKVATLAALLRALSDMPAFAAWCGAIGGDAATALPLQPAAGFGSYEAGVALAATTAGAADWRAVIAAALVVHVAVVACSVLGAGLLWRARRAPPGTLAAG